MLKKIVALIVLLFCILPAQETNSGRAALKLRAGTLGFGGELVVSIIDKVNLRAGLNTFTFPYTYKDTEQEMEADIDLSFQTISFLCDYYPWNGTFHFTTGLLMNNNAINLQITPTGTYEVGVKTFSSDEIGVLDGVVNFAKFNPYVGIGWSNATCKRIGLSFDLGMIYQDSPNFDFEATGMISGTADQDVIFEDSLQDFRFYPVISLGLSLLLF